MSEIGVTQGYNGTVVQARVNDTVSIELPENPTTGFRWTCEEGGATVISRIGDEFRMGTGSAMGQGGTRVFRFAAVRSGTAQVRCVLARAWEGGTARDSFGVQIAIQGR